MLRIGFSGLKIAKFEDQAVCVGIVSKRERLPQLTHLGLVQSRYRIHQIGRGLLELSQSGV